ncbi:MAG: hypothetical protein NC218_07955 [Acetobacter sp.]|nr:hypothetical protein [Acetobacter sp.]
MAVTVEFASDHEFVCEMSDKEKALVDMIKQANAAGKTSFSSDELSKEDVLMLRELMVKDVKAFSDASKESFSQFTQNARAGVGAVRREGMTSIEEMRRKATKTREDAEARINAARAGGKQGISDFINAGFSDKKETKAVMHQQRVEHDTTLKVQMDTLSMNSEPVYMAQPAEKSPLEQGEGKPKVQPSVAMMQQRSGGR